MKVTLDVSAAGQPSGFGSYARDLAASLARTSGQGRDLTLFWSFRPGRPHPPLPPPQEACRHRGLRIPGRLVNLLWESGLPGAVDGMTGHPDVLHNLSFPVPARCRAALVMTVHDVAPYRLPDTHRDFFPPPDALAARLRRARAVVTDSEFSRSEILSLLPGPLPAIHVAPLGVDPRRFHPLPREAREPVLSRHGLRDGGFLLGIGALQPRKNAIRLLEAWQGLPQEGRPGLVWAGPRGWWDAPILEAFRKAAPEGARWLSCVPAGDLPALYAGAAAFCCPSLYEGFGLPLLEAMACGTPVLSSDRGSLPEVAGGAALLADAGSVDALRQGLERILSDEGLRARLRRDGLARALALTWDRTAERMWEVYAGAAS